MCCKGENKKRREETVLSEQLILLVSLSLRLISPYFLNRTDKDSHETDLAADWTASLRTQFCANSILIHSDTDAESFWHSYDNSSGC